MKFSIFVSLVTLATASAFAPSSSLKTGNVALNAESEQSRKAFFSAGAAIFGAAMAPAIAGAMDQVNIKTPTEQWEVGKPDRAIVKDRMALYTNARTQNNSNFPPIKRLNLERKSPVTRLDLNGPNFDGYKNTYPGLYTSSMKMAPPKGAVAEAAPAVAAPAAAEKTE